MYAMVSPASGPLPSTSVIPAACLSRVIVAVRVIGVSVVSVAVGAVTPAGGVPVAVAELATCPEFTSAWVSVYVAVQVVVAPGASVVTGQDTAPTLASVTPTPVSVTLPVLVTTNE